MRSRCRSPEQFPSYLTQSHLQHGSVEGALQRPNSMSIRLPCGGVDVELLDQSSPQAFHSLLPFITTTTRGAGFDEIAERVQGKWTSKERKLVYSRLKRKKTRSSERTTVSCAGFVIVTCFVDSRHACHCIWRHMCCCRPAGDYANATLLRFVGAIRMCQMC